MGPAQNHRLPASGDHARSMVLPAPWYGVSLVWFGCTSSSFDRSPAEGGVDEWRLCDYID